MADAAADPPDLRGPSGRVRRWRATSREADRPFVTTLQQLSSTASSSIKQLAIAIIKDPAFTTRGTTP